MLRRGSMAERMNDVAWNCSGHVVFLPDTSDTVPASTINHKIPSILMALYPLAGRSCPAFRCYTYDG
ncbi:hypothetical protein NITHO_2110005 [Nitrolancea hollandica Lb]|uniref:Uncharacterized protein n=1 Tax=Nitrolancea hollandica Lb TaxID=1129897 RepID=I4EEZ5_9BACT|nr:hypothetical protein NITHO_2110005 [Nitrolancea hollandica Lb]